MTAPGLSDALLERAPATAEVEHDLGLVVLLLDSPECRPFELSGGGVEIWERLRDGPLSARQLAHAIALQNGLDPAGIQKTVEAFLEQLLEAGLVRPASGGTSL